MPLDDGTVERLLDVWPVARLATVDASGRPHLVPIVFARAGGRLWSPVDGKPKSGRELARVRHLRSQPSASLLLDEYADDWSRLWWIRLDVEGRVVRPVDPSDPEAAAGLDALRAKYPQYGGNAGVPLLGEPPTLLVFSPLAVRSWCAGPGWGAAREG